MHGQFCYPTVAFLRPQFGVFATDGDFATRLGTFATRGGNFATKWSFCYLRVRRLWSFCYLQEKPCGFENLLFLSAIIDSRQLEVIAKVKGDIV